MTATRSSLIVCLGANLPSSDGLPAETCRLATGMLASFGIQVTAVSRFFSTPCFPRDAGPDYVNLAITAKTILDPADVLAALHQIETYFGRKRLKRWGQRTLDLDLIAMDELILPDLQRQAEWMNLAADRQELSAPDRLVLPHPRMHERAFVLVPICDIAPNWQHPVLGRTALDLLDNLDPAETSAVKPL